MSLNLYSAAVLSEIYAITSAGYKVQLGPSFQDAIEISYIKDDSDICDNELIWAKESGEALESKILESLKKFRESHGIPEEILREPS